MSHVKITLQLASLDITLDKFSLPFKITFFAKQFYNPDLVLSCLCEYDFRSLKICARFFRCLGY